jgi:hypothetical protein
LFKHVIGIACSPDFVEKWYSFLIPMKKFIMGAVWSILTYSGCPRIHSSYATLSLYSRPTCLDRPVSFSVFILRMSSGASESAAKVLHLMSQVE